MGSSSSTDMPLKTQIKPIAATHLSMCAAAPTALRVTTSGVWSNKIAIVNARTGKSEFEIRSKTYSSRQLICDAKGSAIVTLKTGIFSRHLKVYDGATNQELGRIDVGDQQQGGAASPLVIEFCDRVTGEQCRLTVHGNWNERVVTINVARGALGFPQPIARLRRPRAGTFEADVIFLEMLTGVDQALIVLVWLVRRTVYLREGNPP